MPRKNNTKPALSNVSGASLFSGATVEKERISSGIPISFEIDQEGILKFLGKDDISEACHKDPGEAIVLKFSDGKRVVSIGELYALSSVDWKPGKYYYLLHKGEIETKFNPMKDIEITGLGMEGEVLNCDNRIHPSGKITLSEPSIAEVNYGKTVNYPFNDNKNFSKVKDV